MLPSVERVAGEILRYCSTHPNACDSVDGIEWWLARQLSESTREEVQAAVDALVERGQLFSHRLSDGSMVYECTNERRSHV